MKVAQFVIGLAAALVAARGISEETARAFGIETPECVYGVINDVDDSTGFREYVPALFVDSITESERDLFFNKRLNRLLLWDAPGKRGSPITKKTVAKRFTVDDGTASVTQSVDLVLTPVSVSAGKTVRLLAIGDSITAADMRDREGAFVGASSWWTFPVEAFAKDNLDRGKNDIRLVAVGTTNVRRGRTFIYRGTNCVMDGCAEGRGSRTTAFYLRHAMHWSHADLPAAWLMLGLKSTTGRVFGDTQEDRNLIRETPQGKYRHDTGEALWNKYRSDRFINRPNETWTDSAEQRQALDKLVAHYEENPENPFFDLATVKAGHDYGFNLGVYLARYKTLADDGRTRLVVGQTAGSNVTDAALFDVCCPTHVAIFLGENDRWHYPGAAPEKVTDDMLMIGKLCRAFDPSIRVAFVCHPSLGVWHPERYEDRVVRQKSAQLNGYKFACMTQLKTKLGNRAAQIKSGLYFLPTFFTMDPTSSEHAHFAENIDSWPRLTIGGNDSVHPGLEGHRSMGFQVYAWILDTLATF